MHEIHAVCLLTLCSVSTCLMYVHTSQKEDDRAGMWMCRMWSWYHVFLRRTLPPINQPGADTALTGIRHQFKTPNTFGHFILKLLASIIRIFRKIQCPRWAIRGNSRFRAKPSLFERSRCIFLCMHCSFLLQSENLAFHQTICFSQ